MLYWIYIYWLWGVIYNVRKGQQCTLQVRYIVVALLQRTLKNYALWKFFSKCVKFGTQSTHLEKKYFFSKCVNISHINALWKKNRKSNFAWLALFLLFKNFKDNYEFWKWIYTIKYFIDDSINCTLICQEYEAILLWHFYLIKISSCKESLLTLKLDWTSGIATV